MSQQPEVPIASPVTTSATITKELFHQPEAQIEPQYTTNTKELSQRSESISDPQTLSSVSKQLSQKPQGLDTINQNGGIIINVPGQVKVHNEPQFQIITDPNIALTTPIKELSLGDTGKNDNDVITLTKPGFQVCTLEYNVLPVVGTLYIVNSDHNLVKVIYEPDMVYQTDGKGILHRIGLLKKPEVSA